MSPFPFAMYMLKVPNGTLGTTKRVEGREYSIMRKSMKSKVFYEGAV